jgi:hypothetical protein
MMIRTSHQIKQEISILERYRSLERLEETTSPMIQTIKKKLKLYKGQENRKFRDWMQQN